MVCAINAQAQDASGRYELRIDGGKLGQVVEKVHDQTNVEFLYSFDLVDADGINPVNGQYTLNEALAIMFKGTGLSGGLTNSGMIVITREKSAIALNREDQEVVVDKKFRRSLLASVSALFIGSLSANALGKENADGTVTAHDPDEIIVTATKRATSLQDTAMALSVLSGKALDRQGLISVEDFVARIPGVTLIGSDVRNPSIKIRGVTTTNVGIDPDANGGNVGTVATYLDEFSLGTGSIPVRLVDMERIEVLKGPQGTLYGQSAMGGAVRYITNKPNTDKVEGGGRTYYSNTAQGGSNYGIQGYLNVPLSDTLAVRGVLYKYSNDGYIDAHNVWIGDVDGGTEGHNLDNVNSTDVFGGRIALRWAPVDRISLDLQFLSEAIDAGAYANATQTFDHVPPGSQITLKPIDLSNLQAQIVNPNSSEFKVLNVKLDVDFEPFTMSILGAHKNIDIDFNLDAAPFAYITQGGFPGISGDYRDIDTLELRLTSNDEPNEFLNWIAGIWFEDYKGRRPNLFYVYQGEGTDFFGIPNGGLYQSFLKTEESREIAGYVDLAVHPMDKLTVAAGFRRSNLRYALNTISDFGAFFPAPGSLLGVDTTVSQNVNTYRFNIKYDLADHIMVYGQAASGYRRGGYSAGSFDGQIPSSQYDSDSLWNYEIGARTSWFDGRLVANANIYRIDWSDMQLLNDKQVITDTGVSRVTVVANIGKAVIKGAELELRAKLSDKISIGGTYGYIDAKAKTAVPEEEIVAGQRLPGSSKNSYSIYADLRHPLSADLNLTAFVIHQYSGDIVNTLGQGFSTSGFIIPPLALTNLQIGLEHSDGLTIRLFADNLFNKVAVRGQFEAQVVFQAVNKPRTIGVRLGYDF